VRPPGFSATTETIHSANGSFADLPA